MGAPSRPTCPQCGRQTSLGPENPTRPFCSTPCKLLDLERWLSGAYRVPGPSLASSSLLEDDAFRHDRPNGEEEP